MPVAYSHESIRIPKGIPSSFVGKICPKNIVIYLTIRAGIDKIKGLVSNCK